MSGTRSFGYFGRTSFLGMGLAAVYWLDNAGFSADFSSCHLYQLMYEESFLVAEMVAGHERLFEDIVSSMRVRDYAAYYEQKHMGIAKEELGPYPSYGVSEDRAERWIDWYLNECDPRVEE